MSEKVFDWLTDSKSKMAALVNTAFKMPPMKIIVMFYNFDK